MRLNKHNDNNMAKTSETIKKAEETTNVLRDSGKEITDDELEHVSGGAIFMKPLDDFGLRK